MSVHELESDKKSITMSEKIMSAYGIHYTPQNGIETSCPTLWQHDSTHLDAAASDTQENKFIQLNHENRPDTVLDELLNTYLEIVDTTTATTATTAATTTTTTTTSHNNSKFELKLNDTANFYWTNSNLNNVYLSANSTPNQNSMVASYSGLRDETLVPHPQYDLAMTNNNSYHYPMHSYSTPSTNSLYLNGTGWPSNQCTSSNIENPANIANTKDLFNTQVSHLKDMSMLQPIQNVYNGYLPKCNVEFKQTDHQKYYFNTDETEIVHLTTTPDDQNCPNNAFNGFYSNSITSKRKHTDTKNPVDLKKSRPSALQPNSLSYIDLTEDACTRDVFTTDFLIQQNALMRLFNQKAPSSTENNPGKEDGLYNELLKIENMKALIRNTESFECPICYKKTAKTRGIVLRNCLHKFCKSCLVQTIKNSEETQIQCPYVDNNTRCIDLIQEREIRCILTKAEHKSYLNRSVRLAESTATNSFHCKKINCDGWCIVENNVMNFKCTRCKSENCIPCNAIHPSFTCEEYREFSNCDVDTQSAVYIKRELQNGKAKLCPNCHVVIYKNKGCDHMTCKCSYEFYWSTREKYGFTNNN